MSAVLKIGLTGGIASGKSTVCKLFAELGTDIIDADIITREIMQPGSIAHKNIIEQFGNTIMLDNNEIDRQALRKIIFSENSYNRTKLEDILHPLVFSEIKNRLETVQSEYCIIAIPLLVETGSEHLVDRVLVIDAPEETRISRAMDRDSVPPDQIKNIITSQTDTATRLAAADDIIINDGSLTKLRDRVLVLHNLYKNMVTGLSL